MNTKKTPILLVIALFSVTAFAGFSQPAQVIIEVNPDGSGTAGGDMTTARNSLNAFEFIGCGIRTYDFGSDVTYSRGFCQASIEEGVTYTCFTESPPLLDAINGVSDFAYITFSWHSDPDAGLVCNRVGSSTQSFYLEEGRKIK